MSLKINRINTIDNSAAELRPPRGGIYPVWKGSIRWDRTTTRQPTPVSKRDAVALFHQARKLECSTRKPGHQDGKVTRGGLLVLHALVFDFQNWKTGRCDPSYDAIAAKAGMSIRSVARAIAALKACGLLAWLRRCVGDIDTAGRFCLRQISNWYSLVIKNPCPAPDQGTWGDHPNTGDAIGEALGRLQAGVPMDGCVTTLEADGDVLAAALARLARVMRP